MATQEMTELSVGEIGILREMLQACVAQAQDELALVSPLGAYAETSTVQAAAALVTRYEALQAKLLASPRVWLAGSPAQPLPLPTVMIGANGAVYSYSVINLTEVPKGVRFDVSASGNGQLAELGFGGFGAAEHGLGAPYARRLDCTDGKVTYYKRTADLG